MVRLEPNPSDYVWEKREDESSQPRCVVEAAKRIELVFSDKGRDNKSSFKALETAWSAQ